MIVSIVLHNNKYIKIDMRQWKSLFEYCVESNNSMIKLILQCTTDDVNQHNKYLFTPLMVCCIKENYEGIELLFQREDLLINENNEYGLDAFFYLVCKNNYKCLSLFLQDKRFNINKIYYEGNSLLMINSRYITVFKMLLQHPDIDVNHQNDWGISCLMSCCFLQYDECIDLLLLHKKININQQDKDGISILQWCCYNNYYYGFKKLIQHKDIDINQQDTKGRTIVHVCVSILANEFLKLLLLLRQDVNINLKDDTCNDALAICDLFGNHEGVSIINTYRENKK